MKKRKKSKKRVKRVAKKKRLRRSRPKRSPPSRVKGRKSQKVLREQFKTPPPASRPKSKAHYIPVVGDEDELEEWAEQWGVTVDQAEDLLEYIEESTNLFDPPLDDEGRPDDEYMLELAEVLDIDVSDLYDLYYGCTPGVS